VFFIDLFPGRDGAAWDGVGREGATNSGLFV